MIGQRIKELRTAKNLTQEVFAKEMNISRSALALYETGKRDVPNELIPKLAKFFGVSAGYLFDLEN